MRLDFKKIYVQESIADNPLWQQRASDIIARFPAAEIVPVKSHWQIPDFSVLILLTGCAQSASILCLA